MKPAPSKKNEGKTDSEWHRIEFGPKLDAKCPLDDSKLTYFTHVGLEATNYICRGLCSLNYGIRPSELKNKRQCHLSPAELKYLAGREINRRRGKDCDGGYHLFEEYLSIAGWNPKSGSTLKLKAKAIGHLEQLIMLAHQKNINLCMRIDNIRFYDGEVSPQRYEKLLRKNHPFHGFAGKLSLATGLIVEKRNIKQNTHRGFHSNRFYGAAWDLQRMYFRGLQNIAGAVQPLKACCPDIFVKVPSLEEAMATTEYQPDDSQLILEGKVRGKDPRKVPHSSYPLQAKMSLTFLVVPCEKYRD